MSNNLITIFENLRGEWSFDRVLEDLVLQKISTASGVASFLELNVTSLDSLSYIEIGNLFLQDVATPIKFTRKYIYKILGDRIDVILDDGVTKGELFQTLKFEGGTDVLIGSEHICKLERHNGKYFIKDEFTFSIEYTIHGPKTNLRIRTTYHKITEANPIALKNN